MLHAAVKFIMDCDFTTVCEEVDLVAVATHC